MGRQKTKIMHAVHPNDPDITFCGKLTVDVESAKSIRMLPAFCDFFGLKTMGQLMDIKDKVRLKKFGYIACSGCISELQFRFKQKELEDQRLNDIRERRKGRLQGMILTMAVLFVVTVTIWLIFF